MAQFVVTRLGTGGLVACLLTAGCLRSEPDLHPLRGRVAREGHAVTGGGLYFAPEGGDRAGYFHRAGVGKDGTFVAETESTSGSAPTTREGLPAGRYKVTYHPPSNGSKSGLEVVFAEAVTVEPGGSGVTLTLPATMPTGAGQPRDDAPPGPAGPVDRRRGTTATR